MIQRACSRLPIGREAIYYRLQRSFGKLALPHDPSLLLGEAVRLSLCLKTAGASMDGARVMEVGTGWRMDMPIGFFLCGAKSVVTVDLHRYRKADLVMESVRYIQNHRDRYVEMFSRYAAREAVEDRLARLGGAQTISQLERIANIEYRAPSDAAATGLAPDSIDIQISFTVFEHIPGEILFDILTEGGRVMSRDGVALHHVDLSDHFSHDDASITSINFLRYSDAEWERMAGNQFAYHNRLRVDDYRQIYDRTGHRVIEWAPTVDERARQTLRDGFPLHPRYRGLAEDSVCTRVLRVISSPRR